MSESEAYEVFTVRYATKQDRKRRENFILADPHDASCRSTISSG
jgi:hypothetical protein